MESVIFIAEDGHTYRLTTVSDRRSVLNFEGTGMPPIEYVTQRGAYQHGETVLDSFLRPRILQYLYRANFCSREAYWEGRTALLDGLRPNRGLNGVLRTIRPGNIKRDLKVAIVEGPKFEPDRSNTWDQWSIQEVLRFIAHDPVYFDPVQRSHNFGPCGSGGFPYSFPFPFSLPCELAFPVTFPITFSEFNMLDDLTNAGTWLSYPTIKIFNQSRDVRITNETTGAVLDFLGYDAPNGSEITIDLSFSAKTVEDANGNNLIEYLGDDSDLGTFSLAPGANNIRVQLGSWSATTYVQFLWLNRYIGI